MDIKIVDKLTYYSLFALALGVNTSITFSALSHILILIPLLYFLTKTDFKSWKKSQWLFLSMIIAVIASVLFNQDIAVKGYSPLTKTKYYFLGLLSIAPIQHWYSGLDEQEKVKKVRALIMALFVTTVVAGLYGMLRTFYGINPLHLKFSDATRNTGFFGMVLNFAHNIAFVQLLATYFLFNRKETQKFIGDKFLIFFLIVNLISLYTTFSRGALLAYLAAIPFIFLKKRMKIFFSMIVMAVICLIVVNTVPSLKVSRPGSDRERISQWKTAVKAFEERPVFGQGYLNFEKMCPALKVKYNIEEQQFCGHAHNIFLEMLASTGLAGFIFFGFWLVLWIYEMMKRKDMVSDVTIPLIVVFIVGGMTQATFTLGANLFLIMALYSISMIKIEGKNS